MNKIKINGMSVMIFALLITGIDQNVRAEVSVQDSLFLIPLYNSTAGPNWTNNTNWLTEQPLSTW